MQNHNYSKGSTLLLAMVIISTVLFAGIGVGTILSRQIREIATIENEAVAFYVADTVAEAIFLEIEGFGDMEDSLDWKDMGLDKEVRYKATKMPSNKYEITVGVGNDYYKFIKDVSGVAENGEIEGKITVYYQTEPWDNWNPPLIVYQYLSGEWGGSGTSGNVMQESSKYVGWHVFHELDTDGHDYVRVAFRDDGTGRDWGDCDSHYHCVIQDETVVNVRQNTEKKIDKADFGYPITIYYNTKGEWEEAHVAYQLADSETIIAHPTHSAALIKSLKMYDVSDKYGEHWHVVHISPEIESGIDVIFYNKGYSQKDPASNSYFIGRESTVNIEKNTGIINSGLPN